MVHFVVESVQSHVLLVRLNAIPQDLNPLPCLLVMANCAGLYVVRAWAWHTHL